MLDTSSKQPLPEFESMDRPCNAVRYLEQAVPEKQDCWHYHDEYELHYIVASSGKAFIGDYIGGFTPGQLYLTGPLLPHSWVGKQANGNGHSTRDKLLHFSHEFVAGISDMVPELAEIMPLLARARFGLLFHGENKQAARMLDQIRDADGAARFGYFCQLMHELAQRDDYSLLSTLQIESRSRLNGRRHEQLNKVVDYLMSNYQDAVPMGRVAGMLGMSESGFSRFFQRSTGRRYRDFVIGLRISKACELLLETDRQITAICFEVGFRNVANFYRRFHERKGLSPREYRRQAWEKGLLP